jgi:hypothetical protein
MKLERKTLRKNNVIVFGLDESLDIDPSKRTLHDEMKMKEIVETLSVQTSDIKKLIRFGKQIPVESRLGDTKPRPMKVIFESQESKNEILMTARNLKDTKYKKVFIVPILTVKEREYHKLLMEERNQKKTQGLDMIIFQGKLVSRRQKEQVYTNSQRKKNIQQGSSSTATIQNPTA